MGTKDDPKETATNLLTELIRSVSRDHLTLPELTNLNQRLYESQYKSHQDNPFRIDLVRDLLGDHNCMNFHETYHSWSAARGLATTKMLFDLPDEKLCYSKAQILQVLANSINKSPGQDLNWAMVVDPALSLYEVCYLLDERGLLHKSSLTQDLQMKRPVNENSGEIHMSPNFSMIMLSLNPYFWEEQFRWCDRFQTHWGQRYSQAPAALVLFALASLQWGKTGCLPRNFHHVGTEELGDGHAMVKVKDKKLLLTIRRAYENPKHQFCITHRT